MGICCMTQGTQTATLYQHRGMGWGGRWDGDGDGMEVQEGEDMCLPVADSCWCLTENNKIL